MSASLPFLVEGSCSSGGRVLYWSGGFTTERRFYDGAGHFQALQIGTDNLAEGCNRRWPDRITCGDAVVTRVICGALIQVGEPILY